MNNFRFQPARRACLALIAAGAAALSLNAGAADAWPSRQVKILVPAPAGGTSDIVARAVAEAMHKNTGQSVIVDNKPGAAGAIAADAFLAAPRDGYTLLFAPSSLVTEVPYTIKPRYDPFKDIVPVAELASIGLVLVANPALPLHNLKEMVAYVKANPGKTTFASYSPGTISHVKGLQFNKLAGTDMTHVPYKGSPPALQDLVGGQVQFMFDGIATSAPFVKGGKLRALAVTSAQRSVALPDVPTFAELGLGELTQTIAMDIFTTPDVPADVQARVRAELLKALASPEVVLTFQVNGLQAGPAVQTTEELKKVLKRDYEHTGDILRSVDYKP
jgi:tripartite-type tricarboxylate transporter receptor subunit TctC